MVEGLVCEQCGKTFSARKQRVDAGYGRFCSITCSNKFHAKGENKKYVGKENGKMSFDKVKNSYYVYWFEPVTLKRKTTSFARWYWEVNVGEIPDGYRASYKDGDTLNISPENIVLISPQEFGEAISNRMEGIVFSDETKKKMSEAKKNTKLSEEHKQKIGLATKQRWEAGDFDAPEIRSAYSRAGASTLGSKRTPEQLVRMSEAHKGIYVKQAFTPEAIEKRRQKLLGRKQTKEAKENQRNAMKGIVFTEEHRDRLSEAGKNRTDIKGENSRWWKGGVSSIPYPQEFSSRLKSKIRQKYNHTCQSCGENLYRSARGHVHHIDGDKSNCSEENLVLLCIHCHNAVHNEVSITNYMIEHLKTLLVLPEK